MASPAPLTEIGSLGVRTRKRPAGSEATRSIASAGVSSVCSEVTSTTRGPSACTASIAASASRRVALRCPASRSSSNWFGVTTSAAGTARSRMNSGMPGRTNTPRPTSPITGSQQ